MTSIPTFTMPQPYATLCATLLPCPACARTDGYCGHWADRMVKRFVTQSRPCPEKYRGQRIGIHAAKRVPDPQWLGDWRIYPVPSYSSKQRRMHHRDNLQSVPLAFGAVVATAVVTRSLPIQHWADTHPWTGCVLPDESGGLTLVEPSEPGGVGELRSIGDQLPYGDWTPGRWAWPLTDVEPLAEPVPAKGHGSWWMWSP